MTDILPPPATELPDEYLIELGRLTAWWAVVEDGLEGACRVSYMALGAKKLMPREGLPRSLDKKLMYIKKAAKQLPRLAPQKAVILQILHDTHSLKAERHRLTKSAAFPAAGDAATMKLLRWRYAPKGPFTEHTTSSPQEVAKLNAKVRTLATQWLNVSLALCREAYPAFFDESPREATRKFWRFFPFGKRRAHAAN